MTFFDQTKIARNELDAASEFRNAVHRARHRRALSPLDQARVRRACRGDLEASNHHARTLWGQIICKEIADGLCNGGNGKRHHKPIFFLTLTDTGCVTELNRPLSTADLKMLKDRLRRGLRDLDFFGVMEPAFYLNLQRAVTWTANASPGTCTVSFGVSLSLRWKCWWSISRRPDFIDLLHRGCWRSTLARSFKDVCPAPLATCSNRRLLVIGSRATTGARMVYRMSMPMGYQPLIFCRANPSCGLGSTCSCSMR